LTKKKGRVPLKCGKYRLCCMLHIILPVVAGTLIYIFFRPDTYISGCFSKAFGVTGPDMSEAVPDWVALICRNFLSDMLWAYALTVTVVLIMDDGGKYSVWICLIFELSMELCQKAGILSGTFDWLDIILEICASALAALIIKQTKERMQ